MALCSALSGGNLILTNMQVYDAQNVQPGVVSTIKKEKRERERERERERVVKPHAVD
jgi:hypothetical protein